MSAQPVFGRRGAPPAPRPPQPPHAERSTKSFAPTAAYLEVAEAARAAFQGEEAPADETPAEPKEPVAPFASQEATMRAFIGANWSGYRDLWRAMADAPRLSSSAPFSAAILGGVWLIYRKQYVMGAALLALEALLAAHDVHYAELAHLAAAAFLGRFGKSIVLLGGVAAIAKSHGLDGDAFAKFDAVRAAGGTNFLFALIAFAASSAFLFVTLRAAPAEPDAVGLLRNVLNALP